MQPDLKKAIAAAWSHYVATIPDRSDLSDYHLARDKELFTAGYLAVLPNKVLTGTEPASGSGYGGANGSRSSS